MILTLNNDITLDSLVEDQLFMDIRMGNELAFISKWRLKIKTLLFCALVLKNRRKSTFCCFTPKIYFYIFMYAICVNDDDSKINFQMFSPNGEF